MTARSHTYATVAGQVVSDFDGPKTWDTVEHAFSLLFFLRVRAIHRAPIRKLALLRNRIRTDGGRIVVYQSMWSLLLLCGIHEKAVWIAPGKSRRWRGLLHSLTTMLIGWPSLEGIFVAPLILSQNLVGGRDITQLVMIPPPHPDSPEFAAAMEASNRPSGGRCAGTPRISCSCSSARCRSGTTTSCFDSLLCSAVARYSRKPHESGGRLAGRLRHPDIIPQS